LCGDLQVRVSAHCGGTVRILKDGDSGQTRDRLAEEFQSLLAQLRGEVGEARHIAGRSRQARYKLIANGIPRVHDHDGNHAGRLASCFDRGHGRHHDIHRELRQCGCRVWRLGTLPLSQAVLDQDVLTLDVT
jgi:hypothetical protein